MELSGHRQFLYWGDATDAHVGSLVVVSPEPVGGGFLNLRDRVKQSLAQSVVTHGAVVALNVGVLLGLAGLDVFHVDVLAAGPVPNGLTQVFRTVVAADYRRSTPPLDELVERANHPR